MITVIFENYFPPIPICLLLLATSAGASKFKRNKFGSSITLQTTQPYMLELYWGILGPCFFFLQTKNSKVCMQGRH